MNTILPPLYFDYSDGILEVKPSLSSFFASYGLIALDQEAYASWLGQLHLSQLDEKTLYLLFLIFLCPEEIRNEERASYLHCDDHSDIIISAALSLWRSIWPHNAASPQVAARVRHILKSLPSDELDEMVHFNAFSFS